MISIFTVISSYDQPNLSKLIISMIKIFIYLFIYYIEKQRQGKFKIDYYLILWSVPSPDRRSLYEGF